jgi:hypothetical protein
MRLLSALVVAAAVVTGEGTRDNLRGLIAAGLEASAAGSVGCGKRGEEGDKCHIGCPCNTPEWTCDVNLKCKKDAWFAEFTG